MLTSGDFPTKARLNLDDAYFALQITRGLCWHVPFKELHEEFIRQSRANQLLVVQPALAAMVYAKNSKTNCFTGFYQVFRPKSQF